MEDSKVQIVDQGGELVARWIRAEQAFEAVRLKGMSLRQAAQDMGVSHDTIWKDIRAYEGYLAKTQAGSLDEKRAAFLAQCFRLLAKAEKVFDDAPPQSLNRTGALNTMVSILSHIRAVQGLDVPKDSKPPAPTGIRVTWGSSEGES